MVSVTADSRSKFRELPRDFFATLSQPPTMTTSPPPDQDPAQAAESTVNMTLKEALELGRRHHVAGNLETAEQIYREILRVKPQQQEALHFLGMLAHQTGNSEAALDLMLAAIKIDPGYVAAINNLGNVLMHVGLFERAEFAFRRAIELDPNFVDGYSNLAAACNMAGKSEEALAMCLRAVQLTPELESSELELAESLAAEGQVEQAASAFQSTLMRRRLQPDLYGSLGHALSRLGKLTEAAELFRNWIRLDPENPRPGHLLASCTGVAVPERASNEYIQDVFDKFSESFDTVLKRLDYSGPHLMIETITSELAANVPCDVLLDAGCGTGLCGPLLRPIARKMIGIDLSAGMLAKARERAVYDELLQVEITEFLRSQSQAYDVISSADVLSYFGELSAFAAASANGLKPGGLLVFTVEKANPEDAPGGYRLQYHGRYSHTDTYLRSVFEMAGFRVTLVREIFLRSESGKPVSAWLVAARSANPYDQK